MYEHQSVYGRYAYFGSHTAYISVPVASRRYGVALFNAWEHRYAQSLPTMLVCLRRRRVYTT